MNIAIAIEAELSFICKSACSVVASPIGIPLVALPSGTSKTNQWKSLATHNSRLSKWNSWTVKSQLIPLVLSGVKCNSSIRFGVVILTGSASTTTALSWSPIVKRCSEPAYSRQATPWTFCFSTRARYAGQDVSMYYIKCSFCSSRSQYLHLNCFVHQVCMYVCVFICCICRDNICYSITDKDCVLFLILRCFL